MSKFTNKVAVVTGASKGIGAAIAKALGAKGASVVVNYASSKSGADAVVDAVAKVFIVPHHRSHKDDFENWRHVNPVQTDTKKGRLSPSIVGAENGIPSLDPNPGTSLLMSIGHKTALPTRIWMHC